MKPQNYLIREKAIRASACAAICGLSISFAMGEYFDSRATALQEWQKNPELISISLPIIEPYQGLAKALKKSDWVDSLAATNILPEEKNIDKPTIIAQEPAVLEAQKPKLRKSADSTVAVSEIHQMLLTVHNAEQKLSQIKSAQPPSAPKEFSADKISMKAAAIGGAEIHGRLLPIGSGVMNGHFEVGLYGGINSSGQPVGYPIAQQILPTGTTDFVIPTKERGGYLYARYTADDGKNEEHWFGAQQNPISLIAGVNQFDISFHPISQPAKIIAARAMEQQSEFRAQVHGHVSTMFVHSGGPALPQAGAIVKLRGSTIATNTNAQGDFVLKTGGIDGPLLIEVVKAGYMPTIVRVGQQELKDSLNIEIASKDAIDQMANNLGIRQSISKSVLLGKAPVAGQSAQLTMHADGPFYFSKEGYPASQTDLRSTSADGRFIYFNVESSVGTLEVADQGEIIPAVISAVDGGGLIFKQLHPMDIKIRGRLLNPILNKGAGAPIAGAHVKFSGSTEWATTDAQGAFEMSATKAYRGEDIAIEVSAEHFYNHRYIYHIGEDPAQALSAPISLFAFPASYINMLANSGDVTLDPYAGVILGGVGHRALRLDALAEHADTNNAKDYYFDARGALKGSFAQTDKNFGTYVIFNVPKGRVLLHGLDSAGNLRYSNITYTSPSTINVVVQ